MKHRVLIAVMSILGLGVSACGGLGGEAKYPTGADRATTNGDIYAKPESVFGEGGISVLGDKSKGGDDVITVNSFLWRASLDTVSFMPLATVDPFGGVILTDWYSDDSAPGERYKLNIFVMGRELRSDGVKVSMFKQRNGKNVAVDEKTNRDIEDAILTRARELRVAASKED